MQPPIARWASADRKTGLPVIARLGCIASGVAACFLLAACGTSPAPVPDRDMALRTFLQEYAGDDPSYQMARYFARFADLNQDGTDEAVVYLYGPQICGTGGCNTLVLEPDAESFRVVSDITVSRPPIRMLDAVTNNWHSLAVLVAGGGLEAYEAELPFDGTSYTTNPTVEPARPAPADASGTVLIEAHEDFTQGTPLFAP